MLALSGVALPGSAAGESSEGARAYLTHCAVCHGVNGKGDGPMAHALIRRPKDLTRLSEKNGGSFPESVVYQIIDGRRIFLLHGTREMPVWGSRFRRAGREADVDALIGALVDYVERLQAQ